MRPDMTTVNLRHATFAAVALLLSLHLPRVLAQTTPPAIDIASRRELFVDRFLIDRLTGTAALQLHRPVDCGHVLEFDRPWEGAFSAYVTIIRAPDKFQAFYRGSSGSSTKNT